MNKKEFSLLVIYAIWLQISPWHPSVYSCFMDILMTLIIDITLIILYQYYQSIPESKTSFLHYIMKVIVVSMGLTSTGKMCVRSLFNLAPDTAIHLLYRFTSVICMVYNGYGFGQLTFCSIMILITLRALFNAYPNLMFLIKDDHLTVFFWIVIVMHQINGFFFFYLQSYTMCDKNSLESLQVTLNLQIDESKIGTYEGVSAFAKVFLWMPIIAEIFSRLVSNYRIYLRKQKLSPQNNKNKIIPARQVVVENKEIVKGNSASNDGEKLNTGDIFKQESEINSSSSPEDMTKIKSVICDGWISPKNSAAPSPLSLKCDNNFANVDLKDTKQDIVSVDIHSLHLTNSENVEAVKPNKLTSWSFEMDSISTAVDLKDAKQDIISVDIHNLHDTYSEGDDEAVKSNMLTSCSLDFDTISTAEHLKDTELDIISVDRESIHSLHQSNSEKYVEAFKPNKTSLQSFKISTDVNLKDTELDIISVDRESIHSLHQSNSEKYVEAFKPNKTSLRSFKISTNVDLKDTELDIISVGRESIHSLHQSNPLRDNEAVEPNMLASGAFKIDTISTAEDLKDNELDRISVDRESIYSLNKTNSKVFKQNKLSSKFAAVDLKDTEQNIIDLEAVEPKMLKKVTDKDVEKGDNDNISLGLVGFNILFVLILLFSFAKIILATGLTGQYKDQIEYLIILSTFKMGRLVESMLPLYWLLRKQDTRRFAVRKLKYWKDFLF